MPTVSIEIEPSEKYHQVVHGYHEMEGPAWDEDTDADDETVEAAESYAATIEQTPTVEEAHEEPTVVENQNGDVVGGCPYCDRRWRMSPRNGRVEQAKEDVRSRIEAHYPCDDYQDETDPLSWDWFSVSKDPDLVAKIATYFDGMDPDEPTDLLRAKLRLLECETYANAQIAAQGELREQ